MNNKSQGEEKIDKVVVQPLLIRVFHWLIAFSVTVLLITGFYINTPIFLGGYWTMGINKFYHSAFSILLTFLVIGRVYYAYVTKDKNNFKVGLSDLTSIPHIIRYYLYLTEIPPPVLPKYNGAQKLTYLSWLWWFLIQAVTGYAMLFPFRFPRLIRMLGGVQTLRVVHYLAAVWFLITVFIHIYLVLTEDPAKLQGMFSGVVRKKMVPKGKHRRQG